MNIDKLPGEATLPEIVAAVLFVVGLALAAADGGTNKTFLISKILAAACIALALYILTSEEELK